MKLKGFDYQAYMHGTKHVDVDLMVPDRPTISLCNIKTYLGGVDSFGDPATFAAQIRADLEDLAGRDTEIIIKRDSRDGSIDIFRQSDGALMFSATAETVRGADWVEVY